MEPEQTPTTEELAEQNIDVYDGKTGPWNPDHGDVDIPDGWEFLPAQLATARVKSEKTRARQEERYHDELRDAVLEFLAFTPEHAELAARAHIRHHHTEYHHDLDRIPLELDDDELCREARGSAHLAVDEFLRAHRGD